MDIAKTDWLRIEEKKENFKEVKRGLELIVILETLLTMVEEDGEGIYPIEYIRKYLLTNINEEWSGVKISNMLSETSIISGNLKPGMKPHRCFLLNTESLIKELNLRRTIQITEKPKIFQPTPTETKFVEAIQELVLEKDQLSYSTKEVMDHIHNYKELENCTKYQIGLLMKKLGYKSKPRRMGTIVERAYEITPRSIKSKLQSYYVTALQCNLVTE